MSIADKLNESIPRELVSTRAGGFGKDLDYVSHRYVKNRLNEVFGWDGWEYTVQDVRLFPESKTAFVHVRLLVYTGKDDSISETSRWERTIERDGLAYGYGRNTEEGFDFAIAEAVTDALKRAAVSLGNSLGLELYPMVQGKGKETTKKAPTQRRRVKRTK